MEEQNITVEKKNSPNLRIIILAIAAVAIIAIICVLAFPSTIPSDYKELRKNLRDEGYEVNSTTDRDEALDAYAGFIYTLCYYEDKGLEDEVNRIREDIVDSVDEAVLKDIEKSVNCAVMAVDEDEENFIIALYFDDKKSAKEFCEIFKPLLVFIKENGSDSYTFEEIKREDFTFGQSGKIVYIATKDALKASK